MIFLHRWPFCIRHHFTFVFVLSVAVIVRFAIESFCSVLSCLFRDWDCWFYKDHRLFFNFYMFYEYNRLFCRNVFFTLSAAHTKDIRVKIDLEENSLLTKMQVLWFYKTLITWSVPSSIFVFYCFDIVISEDIFTFAAKTWKMLWKGACNKQNMYYFYIKLFHNVSFRTWIGSSIIF